MARPIDIKVLNRYCQYLTCIQRVGPWEEKIHLDQIDKSLLIAIITHQVDAMGDRNFTGAVGEAMCKQILLCKSM